MYINCCGFHELAKGCCYWAKIKKKWSADVVINYFPQGAGCGGR